jgi:hypothetical protein
VRVAVGGRAELRVSVRTEHWWGGTGADAALTASVSQVELTIS